MDTPPPASRAASNGGDVSPPLPRRMSKSRSSAATHKYLGFLPRYLLRSLLTASWFPLALCDGGGRCTLRRTSAISRGRLEAGCVCKRAMEDGVSAAETVIWKGHAERFR
jgi:hypothetical protein